MEPLILRDRRFWLQKQISTLDAESMQEQIQALEAEVEDLQRICQHVHREDAQDQGIWRCRDCDLQEELEVGAEEPEVSNGGGAESDAS
jgi:ribosomal protein L37AE/L43A